MNNRSFLLVEAASFDTWLDPKILTALDEERLMVLINYRLMAEAEHLDLSLISSEFLLKQSAKQLSSLSLFKRAKSYSNLSESTLRSIQDQGTNINRNKYLIFVSALARKFKTQTNSVVKKEVIDQVYVLYAEGKVLLVDDSNEVFKGLVNGDLYRRSLREALYTLAIIDNLQSGINIPYRFGEKARKEALEIILNNGKILPAGINSQNPDELCIWNIIEQYEKIEDDHSSRINIRSKDKQKSKDEVKKDLSQTLMKNTGVDEKQAKSLAQKFVDGNLK